MLTSRDTARQRSSSSAGTSHLLATPFAQSSACAASPATPDNPAKGLVWTSIVNHVDDTGWDDEWISVVDLDRKLLATHPWTLRGGGAIDVLKSIEDVRQGRLTDQECRTIGFATMHTGADECLLSLLGTCVR